uniref:Bifunctional lysine-specific demethylase and histidyl-hydroxylase n=1 Tax=Angiostrongylus cantonensis TaxID=6313 RepID=A0A0K0DBN2_ANGCA
LLHSQSISDESDEDEGVLDDSTSLLDDEESDEEANLGEYREATVFQNYLEYGTNINIAEYKDGVRFTINGIGRVYPSHLRGHIAVGRSVQFVNPQTFDDRVWYFCEVLQELFGCFIGANTYLTPAGSSGFAPHWDDIDAFLLQLEGRKYWKVYAPDSVSDELPRESSGNFTDGDLKNRKPTFEGWIDAGDLLYIPRGFIHQVGFQYKIKEWIRMIYHHHKLLGKLQERKVLRLFHASLFYIILTKTLEWVMPPDGNNWNVLEVPEAITTLAKNRWKMRKSLPVGMLDMGGVADIDYRLDEHFEKKYAALDRHITALRSFLKKLRDGGIDIMAAEFMKTALPPMLTAEEKTLSVVGSQPDILHGKLMEFRPSTRVKLIRRHAQRLVFENENDCCIVHRMANSRVYEGRPQQSFSLPNEFIDGFNALSVNYPEWMSLSEMPSDMTREQVKGLCHLLYNHGLIMVQQLPDRVKKNVRRRK